MTKKWPKIDEKLTEINLKNDQKNDKKLTKNNLKNYQKLTKINLKNDEKFENLWMSRKMKLNSIPLLNCLYWIEQQLDYCRHLWTIKSMPRDLSIAVNEFPFFSQLSGKWKTSTGVDTVNWSTIRRVCRHSRTWNESAAPVHKLTNNQLIIRWLLPLKFWNFG